MIKAFFELNARQARWNIYFTEYDTNTHRATHEGKAVVMVPMTDIGMVIEPTISLGREEIQELMDDMWQAGLRPSSTSSATDLVEAKDQHIGDLREFMRDLMKKVKIR